MKTFIQVTVLGLVASAVLLCTGCAETGTYDSVKRTRTTNIDVFRDGQKPTKHYKEIALLSDDGGAGEQAAIEAKFVKKAKAMGGNAIIVYPMTKSGGEMPMFAIGWKDTFFYKAAVVVYE